MRMTIRQWRTTISRSLSYTQQRRSDVERLIQTTRVPMLHFQPSLPRLPIPKLTDTCSRYLDSITPVISSQQLSETKNIVSNFLSEGGEGQDLDKRLREQDSQNKHTSYVSEPWYNMYLADRRPLVLNHNPFMAWKEDPHTTDQCTRATNFIRAAILFRNSLVEEQLEPEMFHLNPQKSDNELFRNIVRLVPSSLSWYMAYLWKVFPLDMSQYPRLLCSTRLPQCVSDKLVSYPGHTHIVIMRNGHFYSLSGAQSDGILPHLDCLMNDKILGLAADDREHEKIIVSSLPFPNSRNNQHQQIELKYITSTPVSSDVISSQLRWIMDQPSDPPPYPLSYLTASDRDLWANIRQKLENENEENLKIIDSALFVLSLDDHEVTNEVNATHQLLHNYGSNRWFDKSFNLIVTKNGLSAINFEHAWGDGVAVLRFFNELYNYTTSNPCSISTGSSNGDGVRKLEFKLSENVKAAVDKTRTMVEKTCNTLSVCAAQYDKYGSQFIKKCGLKADPFMQLAFQITYYRLFGELVPSYESCSTAAFRHGRTETIRPATSEAKTCAELLDTNHPASTDEMMAAIKIATEKHFSLTRNAAMGQGFDRHMFALRTLAESEGKRLDIFTDPTYHYMNHIILSTSTLSTDSVLIGGFAPVTPDGYGLGYNVSSDSLGCNVTTYPARNGAEYVSCLHQTFNDLYSIMTGSNFK